MCSLSGSMRLADCFISIMADITDFLQALAVQRGMINMCSRYCLHGPREKLMLGADIFIYILLGLGLMFFILGLKSQKGQAIGVIEGTLAAPKDKPNCAASENCDLEKHYVKPLKATLNQAKAAVIATDGIITSETDSYVSATYMSKIFKFVKSEETFMPSRYNEPPRKIDHARVKSLVKELLEAIGEDPEREGLLETPRRIANFWSEFIEYDAGKLDTTFSAVKHNQMVAVTGMRVWSMCEHHMLPFWCDVSIAYIADDKVLGLSKFARIAHKHAHKIKLHTRQSPCPTQWMCRLKTWRLAQSVFAMLWPTDTLYVTIQTKTFRKA